MTRYGPDGVLDMSNDLLSSAEKGVSPHVCPRDVTDRMMALAISALDHPECTGSILRDRLTRVIINAARLKVTGSYGNPAVPDGTGGEREDLRARLKLAEDLIWAYEPHCDEGEERDLITTMELDIGDALDAVYLRDDPPMDVREAVRILGGTGESMEVD